MTERMMITKREKMRAGLLHMAEVGHVTVPFPRRSKTTTVGQVNWMLRTHRIILPSFGATRVAFALVAPAYSAQKGNINTE